MCVKEQEEQRGQSAKEDPHPKRQKTCEWATDTQTLRASVLKRRPVGDNAIMQRHRSCCCTAVLRVKRFVTSCAVLCGAVVESPRAKAERQRQLQLHIAVCKLRCLRAVCGMRAVFLFLAVDPRASYFPQRAGFHYLWVSGCGHVMFVVSDNSVGVWVRGSGGPPDVWVYMYP
mgnify:CR=1 FL=1